ncbi:MAG: IPT/TIG domain-containing protein [bacterium]
MKSYKKIKLAALFMAVIMAVVTGCKYDVAEPQYYQDHGTSPTPVITSVVPAGGAAPGYNTITINGQNFETVPDVNGVYFGNVAVEVLSKSNTSLVVRRPNLVTDACNILVVPSKTLVSVKHGPYSVDNVFTEFDSFLENVTLATVAVDAAENVYILESATRNIIKVTPSGEKTVVGTTTRAPYDVRFGPGGKMYFIEHNRSIDVVDLTTGTTSEWIKLPSGKAVRYGDFDAAGNFYCGGVKSGLVVVDPSLAVTTMDTYTKDEIMGVRVFNGKLYVAVEIATPDAEHPKLAIWEHPLDGSTVGEGVVYSDLSSNEDFAERAIRSITFSADGKLIIATDAVDPLLVVQLGGGNADYFYKDILPTNCKHMYWGSGNFLYLIIGDTNAGVDWKPYKVDMGGLSAPYYQ